MSVSPILQPFGAEHLFENLRNWGLSPGDEFGFLVVYRLPRDIDVPDDLVTFRGPGWSVDLRADGTDLPAISDTPSGPAQTEVYHAGPLAWAIGYTRWDSGDDSVAVSKKIANSRSRAQRAVQMVSTIYGLGSPFFHELVWSGLVAPETDVRVRLRPYRGEFSASSEALRVALDGATLNADGADLGAMPDRIGRALGWLRKAEMEDDHDDAFLLCWLAIVSLIEGWWSEYPGDFEGREDGPPFGTKIRHYLHSRVTPRSSDLEEELFGTIHRDIYQGLRNRVFHSGIADVISDEDLGGVLHVTRGLLRTELKLDLAR